MAGRHKARRVLLTTSEYAVFDHMVSMLNPSWYGGTATSTKDGISFTEVRTWDKNGRIFNISLDTAIRRLLKGMDIETTYERLSDRELVVWRSLVVDSLGLLNVYYGQ